MLTTLSKLKKLFIHHVSIVWTCFFYFNFVYDHIVEPQERMCILSIISHCCVVFASDSALIVSYFIITIRTLNYIHKTGIFFTDLLQNCTIMHTNCASVMYLLKVNHFWINLLCASRKGEEFTAFKGKSDL